jgi:HEAT repeat protein
VIPGSRTPEQARRAVLRLVDVGRELPLRLRRTILELNDLAITPLLDLLVDEDLATGYAPSHAASLLGDLRAAAAIDPMLELLRDTEWDDLVHDAIISALPKIGAPIVEPGLRAYAACEDFDFRFSLADALARCGTRDDRICARLLELLEIEPDGAALHLADYGDPRAIEHLARAFDEYVPVPTVGPLGNRDLIELRCAIEKLG